MFVVVRNATESVGGGRTLLAANAMLDIQLSQAAAQLRRSHPRADVLVSRTELSARVEAIQNGKVAHIECFAIQSTQ
jgi:hypothetical protein